MKKRGFTLIELLVVIAIIALLIGILLPALARAQKTARLMKCSSQQRDIHKGMTYYGDSQNDSFPLPQKINFEHAQGTSEYGHQFNSSGNIMSVLVFNKYFVVDFAVCPSEVNPQIQLKRDYDFELDKNNSKTKGVWDRTFGGSFIDQNVSNTSYATMQITGRRARQQWISSSHDGNYAVLSDRGVKDGKHTDPTLAHIIHGTTRRWVGNVCYNDNHVDRFNERFEVDNRTIDGQEDMAFVPEGVFYFDADVGNYGLQTPDNIFKLDEGVEGMDIRLGFFARQRIGQIEQANVIYDPDVEE